MNDTHKTRSNIYDNILTTFIALQCFGQIGGTFQPIRVLVILSAPYIFTFYLKNQETLKSIFYERLLFSVWILYGLISILWVTAPSDGFKEIIYLTVNSFAFFLIIVLANKSNRPQTSIIKGWVILFLVTLPVALYELWFDNHLSIATQESGMVMNYTYNIFERRFASVTYGNLNEYNLILCYTIPFVLGVLLSSKNKKTVILNWTVAFLLSYIIIVNGSRAAFLSLIIAYFIFSLYYTKSKKSFRTLIGIIIVVIYVISMYADKIFGVVLARFSEQGFNDDGRTEIFSFGIKSLFETYFFGVGAGNFKHTMDKVYHLELTSPHNLLLEIAVQYGLVILLLFVGYLFRLYKKQKDNQSPMNKFIIIGSLCMFPLTSTIDSGYILNIWIWMFLASMYVIADKQYNTNEEI